MLRDIVAKRRLGFIGIATWVAILVPVCLADDRTTIPDPADPSAAMPPIVYKSALGDFRRFGAISPAPWKAANDTVGTLGGHVGAMAGEDNPGSAPGGKDAPKEPSASPALPGGKSP